MLILPDASTAWFVGNDTSSVLAFIARPGLSDNPNRCSPDDAYLPTTLVFMNLDILVAS